MARQLGRRPWEAVEGTQLSHCPQAAEWDHTQVLALWWCLTPLKKLWAQKQPVMRVPCVAKASRPQLWQPAIVGSKEAGLALGTQLCGEALGARPAQKREEGSSTRLALQCTDGPGGVGAAGDKDEGLGSGGSIGALQSNHRTPRPTEAEGEGGA